MESAGSTRVILIERYGPAEALVERRVPLREPGPGEVQLEVLAAGVNFADLLMRAGLYATAPAPPYSPGFEVAGIVRKIGPATEGWNVGERAVGLIRFGGYAGGLVLSCRQLFRYPASLTPVEAASIPVAFLTAWFGLFESARARPGETVLVLNAAGGVGSAAVQLARWKGLEVVGTAGSETKRRFVTEALGARACFDSSGQWDVAIEQMLGPRPIDVALDPVGGDATRRCRRLLAPLGHLVFYGLSAAMPGRRRNWLSAARAFLRTPRFHPLGLVEPNLAVSGIHLLHLGPKEERLAPALDQIYRAVAAGRIRPLVDRTFPLDRAGAVLAHRYLHDRRVIGKVVLARSD